MQRVGLEFLVQVARGYHLLLLARQLLGLVVEAVALTARQERAAQAVLVAVELALMAQGLELPEVQTLAAAGVAAGLEIQVQQAAPAKSSCATNSNLSA